ncbi:hypothetical protein F2Q70_00003634 [Brassica cretica]|uniref:Uncharacterized protein n=1 Tax=Brassica cretica TaxID=69181 RepID=A0A8S9IYU0_BRACR|nr:hypothetical protein F2Q70_00003634 [Brassica cretica]
MQFGTRLLPISQGVALCFMQINHSQTLVTCWYDSPLTRVRQAPVLPIGAGVNLPVVVTEAPALPLYTFG